MTPCPNYKNCILINCLQAPRQTNQQRSFFLFSIEYTFSFSKSVSFFINWIFQMKNICFSRHVLTLIVVVAKTHSITTHSTIGKVPVMPILQFRMCSGGWHQMWHLPLACILLFLENQCMTAEIHLILTRYTAVLLLLSSVSLILPLGLKPNHVSMWCCLIGGLQVMYRNIMERQRRFSTLNSYQGLDSACSKQEYLFILTNLPFH